MTMYDALNQISFFVASFIVTAVTFTNTLIQHRTKKLQNRVFLVVLVNVMICALSETLRITLLPVALMYPVAARIVMLCQGFYFLAHNMLAAMMGVYFMVVNGSFQRSGPVFRFLYLLPFIALELIVLTNPLFHFLYTYNADYTVNRALGGTLTYAISALYIVVAVGNLCIYWYTVPRARWKALLFFTGIVIVGVVIQFINPVIKSELLAEALSFLGVMLAVENEDDRMDMTFGVYNRNALKDDLNSIYRLKRQVGVIGLRVVNYDILMRLLGNSGVDAVIRPVADYLKSLFPWYKIYRVTPTDFIILLDHDSELLVRTSEAMYLNFAEGVHVQNIDTPIRVLMLRALIPEELKNQEDALQVADGSLPETEERGILSGKRISFFTRSTELENALARGIVGKNFEVYYQPVHRLEDMKLYAVKALARLHDKEIGDLMPGEFIPLAERNGMIQQIGEIILEEVCEFIASGEPTSLGIRCVSVNLSFVQCMQPDFTDRVIRMIDRYQVRPDMINFEITKPVNKTDFAILDRVIRELKKKGFLFTMEDYGSGYANIESIFTLDFDVVKIDKSLLWSASQSENGRIILSSSIHLVKELGRKILVEGVESVEQINVLEDFEVDYLLGYYFSKPVKRQEVYTLAEG